MSEWTEHLREVIRLEDEIKEKDAEIERLNEHIEFQNKEMDRMLKQADVLFVERKENKQLITELAGEMDEAFAESREGRDLKLRARNTASPVERGVRRKMSETEAAQHIRELESDLSAVLRAHVKERSEKDAEIDRLKAELSDYIRRVNVKNTLITEMADALGIVTQLLLVSELPTEVVSNKIRENQMFQQRAREATEDE